MKKLFLVLVAALYAYIAAAQDSVSDSVEVQTSEIVAIYFRQGHYNLDLSYRTNKESLESIYAQMAEIYYDSTRFFRHVQIISGTSPEGSYSFNQRLSKNRLNALKNYIQSRLPIPDSIFVQESRGINWIDLIALVEESDMPNKEDMLHILRDVPEIEEVDGRVTYPRKKAMEQLDGGRPYRYMYNHFFPVLRQSCGILFAEKPIPIEPVEIPDIYALTGLDVVVVSEYPKPVKFVKPDPDRIKSPYPEPDTIRGPIFALKTNLLSDLALIPHIGAEVFIADGWTLAANWYYAWWKSDPVHWYWRTYGGDMAVRWYFGEKSKWRVFNGHHLGLFGQISTYDFELGGNGILGDKWSWGVGVEYGYAIPIARHLNLDFTLGVGYFGGEFYKYVPMDTHYVWQSTNNRHYFGPTKLEVSLVWVIGGGSYNKNKEEVSDESK